MVPNRPTNASKGEPTIVVVQFRVALTKRELVDAFTPDVPHITRIPGLRWKFWTLDEASRSFAGVYLFEDAAKADEYLRGPVPAKLRASPHLSDVRAQVYTVLEVLSRATGAPLDAAGRHLDATKRPAGAASVPEARFR